MARGCTLSILGIYEYDPTVFDGFRVPEGLSQQNVLNNILIECAELEIVYPDFDVLKMAIKIWNDAEFYTWDKLYKSMFFEYNPIWNVDANILETTSNERNLTGTDNRDITESATTNENGTSNETLNATDTKSVKGYNSDSWADAEKNTHNSTDGITNSKTTTLSGRTDDDLTRNEKVDDAGERTERRTGNIGVTATQDLIKKEREIAEINMIDYITQSFKRRFCLLIY